MTRALVISGGGSRGCYAAGLVHALAKAGVRWDLGFGTSVGTLILARVCQRQPREQLLAAEDGVADWESINTGSILAQWRGGPAEALARGSLYDTAPLRLTITQRLAERPLVLPLWASAVELATGAYALLPIGARTPHVHDPVSWLTASCAFPVAMPPVAYGGGHWVDGGVHRVIPLLDALEAHTRQETYADADEIDAILCTPPDAEPEAQEPTSGLARLLRVVELATYQRAADDLRRAYLYWQRMDHRPVVRIWWPRAVPTEDPMRFTLYEIRDGLWQGAGDVRAVRWTFGEEVPTWL